MNFYAWTMTGMAPCDERYGAMRYVREVDYERLKAELAEAHEKYNDSLIHATNAEREQSATIDRLKAERDALYKIALECFEELCAGLPQEAIVARLNAAIDAALAAGKE